MLVFYLLFYKLMMIKGSLAATHLLVTHVGPCEDSPVTILTVKEFAIATQTYDSRLSGEFNITEDVENGWTVKAKMQKCQDIRNTYTCDHFSSFHVVHAGCDGDDDEDIYGMLFHYAMPELKCPIRAGVYKLSNYPFFTEDNYLTVYESKISTSIFGYTFVLEGTTVDRRKFFCVEAYLQLLYMRDHNWLSKPKHPQTTAPPKNDKEEDEYTVPS